ncbi:MAG: four helix bundle protein [Deltaproteobacteria bacterium]|nr:four helix bundle protein [Deltaproteobacteria bacterium]
MAGQNYRDLIGWQKAMDLVELVYQATRSFPKEEQFALTSQIRRAAVSIPSNIAEGQGRSSAKEFVNFLSIAHGSVREVETQAMIAQRLKYLTREQAETLLASAAEVGRLIKGLMNAISRR